MFARLVKHSQTKLLAIQGSTVFRIVCGINTVRPSAAVCVERGSDTDIFISLS
jgi:hypothetical protein